MMGTICGAKTATTTDRLKSTRSMTLSTVETTRHARVSSLRLNSPARTGIIAELNAPAATSWKIASGMRNAAK